MKALFDIPHDFTFRTAHRIPITDFPSPPEKMRLSGGQTKAEFDRLVGSA
jgi:hypothetical protein